MATETNDFEAAKAISEILSGMHKDRQERILRWVGESMGLSQPPPARVLKKVGEAVEATSSRAGDLPSPGQRTDIKTFVGERSPKSDVQFVATVAYFHQFIAPDGEKKESITKDDLVDATRKAGWKRLELPGKTFDNAVQLGYVDRLGGGLFKLNAVGENLVAMTMGGNGAATTTSQRRRPQRR